MTPEEYDQEEQAAQLEQQRMMAAALRGEQMRAAQQQRDSEIFSGLGGVLTGLGGRPVNERAAQMVEQGSQLRSAAGDAKRNELGLLEALARRRQFTPQELEAMSARAIKDRAVAANYGKPKPEKDTSFEDETSLRKEVTAAPETKAMDEVGAQFKIMSSAADNPTGDVARIYALAKIYDPGGRVTKDDYEAGRQGQGPMAWLQSQINEVSGNGTLSPSTRSNMLSMATKLYEQRKAEYGARAKTYTDIARKRKLNPEHVVIRPADEGRGAGDIELSSGLDASKRARLEELRKKKAAGTIK